MNIENLTKKDEEPFLWIEVPRKYFKSASEDEPPFELKITEPGELKLTELYQSCRKKELIPIPEQSSIILAGRKQRRASRQQFQIDDTDTDFVKLAGLCTDEFLIGWSGLTTGQDKVPVPFDMEFFKEKLLSRVGMWLIGELFGIAQDMTDYHEEEQNVEKKIS